MFAKKPVTKPKKAVPRHKSSTLSAEIVIESDSDGVVEIASPFGAKGTSKSVPSSTERRLSTPKKKSSFAKSDFTATTSPVTGLGHPRRVGLAQDITPVHNGSSSAKDSSSTVGKFSSNAKPAQKTSYLIRSGSSTTTTSSQNIHLSQKATSSTKASIPKKAVFSAKVSPTTLKAAISVSSGSDSSSSSSTGSVDESKNAGRTQENEDSQLDVDDEQERPTKNAEPKISQSFTQPSIPFEPPTGFKLESVSLSSSSRVSEIFSPANLNGKQIWHMTIPARVSAVALEEASLKSLSRGSAVFHYKNDDYGFAQDLEHEQVQKHVLVATDENEYRTTAVGVSRSLHLKQLVKLPSLAGASQNLISGQIDPAKPRVYSKTVRQQPQGLRMRYRAFGDAGRSSNSASENEDAAPSFKNPPQLEKSPIKKRKIAQVVCDEESQGTKAKKSRKDLPVKHNVNTKERVGDVNLKTDPSPFILGTSKSIEGHEEIQQMYTPSNGVANGVDSGTINGMKAKHGKENREERAKRKEEKKRRKEERRISKGQGNIDREITNKNKRKKHFRENTEKS